MKEGSSGSIIYFPNLTLQLTSTAENTSALQVGILSNNGASAISMPLNPQDIDTAKAAISYIEEMKSSEQHESRNSARWWGTGSWFNQKVSICGKELEISESMDTFNSYRLKFRELALPALITQEKEYDRKVQNLSTLAFIRKYINPYLSVLIKQSMNILISEGV